MYLLLSSDAHPLFKKGIMHVLSYPAHYCDHFRYEIDRDFSKDVQEDLDSIKGSDAVIVYVKGNDLSLPADQRKLDYFPIRKAKIKDTRKDEETGLLHVYIELLDFVSHTPLISAVIVNQGLSFVLKSQSIIALKDIKWSKKIKELISFDPTFKNTLFFHVDFHKVSRKNKVRIVPEFDEFEHSSYFTIEEQKKYLVDISLYNTADKIESFEDYELSITNTSDDLVFSSFPKMKFGTDLDSETISFTTKVLKSITSSGSLIFSSKLVSKKEEDSSKKQTEGTKEIPSIAPFYEIDVRVNNKKTYTNILLYAFLGSFALVSVFLVTYCIALLKEPNAEPPWLLMAAALCSSIISSSGLFYFFNKN